MGDYDYIRSVRVPSVQNSSGTHETLLSHGKYDKLQLHRTLINKTHGAHRNHGSQEFLVILKLYTAM
jgi:hypothetical protein